MPQNISDEERRLACLQRFHAAAEAWLMRRDLAAVNAYLDQVAERHGAEVRARQATELRNWCKRRERK